MSSDSRQWFWVQQLRQLRNVHRYPPSFIRSQAMRYVSVCFSLSCIDVSNRPPVAVEHLESTRYLFDLLWFRSTTKC
ncbi:MAG: hypothetical protein PVG95_04845, partial [Methyloceanibacter sp.]